MGFRTTISENTIYRGFAAFDLLHIVSSQDSINSAKKRLKTQKRLKNM